MALFGLIKNKEQKLVNRWEKEHILLVELAGEILTAYTSGDLKKAKSKIKELGGEASKHVMNEDIEFMKLMKNSKLTEEKRNEIKKFQDTFKKDKLTLLSFLSRYGKDETELDDKFFNEFSQIIEVVSNRIKFEEENLYSLLKK